MVTKKYDLKLTLNSDTLIGSGEGYGAVVDSDVVFDDCGIPYIPAKRVKGLLRDSARIAGEMLETAKLELNRCSLDELFGNPGMDASADISVSNLYVEDYENNHKWIDFFINGKDFHEKISKETVIQYFTSLRRSTQIDEDGVAKDHSLRTARVIKRGNVFYGNVELRGTDDADLNKKECLLALACMNLKNIGTKRNRGFGEVKAELKERGSSLNEKYEGILIKEVEETK